MTSKTGWNAFRPDNWRPGAHPVGVGLPKSRMLYRVETTAWLAHLAISETFSSSEALEPRVHRSKTEPSALFPPP